MISDAQVHLWEADRPDRPMAPDAKPHLPEPMTAERMIGLMDEAGVDRAVISPLYLPDMSAEYALEAAAAYPDRFKVMGWLRPGDAGMLERLDSWLDTPGMCSIRFSLNNPDHLAMFESGALDPFWKALERNQIPTAIFKMSGVSEIEPVAEAYPGLPIIIDHLNMPYPADSRDTKMGQLDSLARFPNVHVKVSALPLFATGPAPFDDLQPMIRRVRDAFGSKRLLWGSDQTMQMMRGLATYPQSIDIIRTGAATYLSPEEIDDILNGTFSRLFRWP